MLRYVRDLARQLQVFKMMWRDPKMPAMGLDLVDIGASYFLHKPWIPLLTVPGVKLVAVDPNLENLAYLDTFKKLNVKKISKALSSEPGLRTLYVTNVDSGSSLFPPDPSAEDIIRNPGLRDYYFPLEKREIRVTTLDDLMQSSPNFIAAKIDTQGAELEILRGATKLFSERKILAVEVEVCLLNRPILAGSPNFLEVCGHLNNVGMELVWIRPTVPVRKSFRRQHRQHEADALFMLQKEEVVNLGPVAADAFEALLRAYGLTGEIQVLRKMVSDST